MAKKIKTLLKMQLPAGQATPGQKVGQALGPHGLNLMEFCSRFNEGTKKSIGDIIPVEVIIYDDRTYELKFKTPPAADLLRKAAGIEKGAANPLKEKVGKVSREQIKQIAEKKMADLNANDIDAAMKIVEGTARSMGIKVE
ncbi:MAG: 50S ribosomal protein L11 [Candidatus Portnoybacteria bacterium RIFCSPLOWO2_02_FULL_39_11]|uniref:Large ribosomal subunit protein uL11 n=1 Tax=Candidatus Portnoybacteria bacterium RIFCSPLOWO2_02_FULL_39_11 TaxID=1802001 RepID=A0A1G2FSI2_9BACT|nr:MAG: 50S ribosomal protein L11 [Candidatus Portnoybacteria bacterium RIFCSPLOWO2_02_FULL_39_11]